MNEQEKLILAYGDAKGWARELKKELYEWRSYYEEKLSEVQADIKLHEEYSRLKKKESIGRLWCGNSHTIGMIDFMCKSCKLP